MFLIPFERSIDWRRPPVMTLTLLLINFIVYFGLQSGSDEQMEEALHYYLHSELPALEFPAYLARLGEQVGEEPPQWQALEEDEAALLVIQLQGDSEFLEQLHGQQLISPAHEQFVEWQAARTHFEALWSAPFTQRYLFNTAQPSLLTLFTSIFMHGSAEHLIGNMVVLVLVGLAVEMALGSLLYLGFYLISGAGAGGLYYLAHSHEAAMVLGASGAISGVMALYAVLFGRRRIRFFYSLLFYFDYVKAPAYIMLLLWLGNELFQLHLGGPGNVAYEAHIGGLLTGALLGVAAKLKGNAVDEHYLDADIQREARQQRFQQGLRLIAQLQVEQGIALFKALHEEQPEELEVLVQLFKATSLRPGSELHHYAAIRLLAPEQEGLLTAQRSHDIFTSYLSSTQGKIRLSPNQLLVLTRRFAKADLSETAERILLALAKGRPTLPGLQEAFHTLAESWRRRGDERRYRAHLQRAQQLAGVVAPT